MSMKISKPAYIDQRSDEWLRLRAGHIGSSQLYRVMSKGKGDSESRIRNSLMVQILAEKYTGTLLENFSSPEIDWGISHEDEARQRFMNDSGYSVSLHHGKECHSIKELWCSPDGLVGTSGGLEIKCPNTTTHLLTMTTGEVDKKYIYQMCGYIIVYNLTFVDFMSYDPRIKDTGLQAYYKRFYIRDLPIAEVLIGIGDFIKDMEKMKLKLEKLKGGYRPNIEKDSYWQDIEEMYFSEGKNRDLRFILDNI